MEQRLEFGGSISIEALTQLASSGATIVIERAGEEVIRLVRASSNPERPRRRRLGVARGMVHIADDFDELPEDLLAAFEGTEESGE